jgi:hypothetical protein
MTITALGAALLLAGCAAPSDRGTALHRDLAYWRGAREASPGPFLCVEPAATGVTVVCDRWPDGSDLRQFGLDAARLCGARTDQERAVAVWRWVRRWKTHTDGNAPTENFTNPTQSKKHGYIDDPIKVLNVYGTHFCDGLSRVVEAVWRALGHPAEKLVLGGHTMAHCHYTDADGVTRWHLFDVNFGSYIPHRSGNYILGADGFSTDYCKNFAQWKHCSHLAMPTHRIELALRRGEKLERIWGNWGVAYQDNIDVKRDRRRLKAFERGPYQPVYGNGRWTYAPNLDSPRWTRGLAEPTVGMVPGKLAPTEPGTPASAVWHVRTPYIVADARVDLHVYRRTPSDVVRLHLSVDNGKTWKKLFEVPAELTGPRALSIPICDRFKVTRKAKPPADFRSPFGRYHYRLKLELLTDGEPRDCQVTAIRFATVVQHNLFALPQLQPGRNRITVRGALAEGAALRVTYVWDDPIGKRRKNVTVIEQTPSTYEILAAGKRWEDCVCKSLVVEAVPATGEGNRTVVKEKPAPVYELPPMRPALETRTRGGLWKRPAVKDLPPAAELVKQLDEPAAAPEAARALLELADPATFDALRRAAYRTDEKWAKPAALAALFNIDRARARPVLLDIAAHPDKVAWKAYKTWKGRQITEHDRWAACTLMIGTMAEEAGWPEFVPLVARVATHPRASRAHRWSAMRLLAEFGDARAAEAVRTCLASGDLNVRAYAALAAGRTGDRSLVPALRKCVRHPYEVLGARAAVSLGQLGDRASAPVLRRMLSAMSDENLRAGAARGLGALGDPDSAAALQAALDAEPIPWVRDVMAEALSKLRHLSSLCEPKE